MARRAENARARSHPRVLFATRTVAVEKIAVGKANDRLVFALAGLGLREKADRYMVIEHPWLFIIQRLTMLEI